VNDSSIDIVYKPVLLTTLCTQIRPSDWIRNKYYQSVYFASK